MYWMDENKIYWAVPPDYSIHELGEREDELVA
jgi:hypothetical protein